MKQRCAVSGRNRPRTLGRSLLAASVAVVPAVVAVTEQPAGAETAFPSGCNTNNANWGTNCWVGAAYSSYSSYVLAVQEELDDFNYSPGFKDCTYGGQTSAAIQRFQAANGLSVDGVVGTNSWTKLNSKLGVDGQVPHGSFVYTYYHANAAHLRFLKISGGGTNAWFVYDDNLSPPAYGSLGANNGAAACPVT